MSIQIRLVRDEVTRDLASKLDAARNLEQILRAVATQLVSLTKRAFREPSLRQHPWPAKKGGEGSSNLIKKGMLVSSIRITSATRDEVTIGTERKYEAIHQLGGVIRAKPGKSLVFTIGGKKIFAK